MKKRILSIILTICMAASLVPVMPATAFAADTCSCLIKCTDSYKNADCPVCKSGIGDCTGRPRWIDYENESIVGDEQLIAIMGWPSSQRDYYYYSLDHYVRFDEPLSPALVVAQDADLILDLKGQNLNVNSNGTLFQVSGKLTIIDTVGTGKITKASGGVFHILEGGSVLMQGGTIEQCTKRGAVIVESGGKFVMTGGTMKNNKMVALDGNEYIRNITVKGSGTVTISGESQILCCDVENCSCSGEGILLSKNYGSGGTELKPTLDIKEGPKIKGSVYNEGTITYRGSGYLATFYGDIKNFGTISLGTTGEGTRGASIYGTIINNGVISGGKFHSDITNNGTISGGIFGISVTVTNNENSLISGGYFDAVVINNGTISGGSFSTHSKVINNGTISGGSFVGNLDNGPNGIIEDSVYITVYAVTDTGVVLETKKVFPGKILNCNDFATPDSKIYGYNNFDYWLDEEYGMPLNKFGRPFKNDENYIRAVFSDPINYTITYNLGGGTASPANPTVYTVESDAITLQNPTNTGYIFAGWTGTGLTGMNMVATIPKGSTGNRTYTANFIAKNLYEVNSESFLQTALNNRATTIKLTGDITLSSELNLSDRIMTIDLNGHTLTGNIKLADTSANPQSILTLQDSSPTANGVLNGSITLTRGNNGTASWLYANGGTVTGKVSTNSYVAKVYCTSDTPTAVKGYAGNYGEIHGGIFYGNINTGCIKEKTVTFQNGSSRYALEVVADGGKVAAPAYQPVKAGYSFVGWYDGDTAYTFGSSLSENITLTAEYSEPITYHISYDLAGGTEPDPANPIGYTVESDAILLNNPTKPNYTFTGWSGTGLSGESNTSVTIPKRSTGDRTYTAHWAPATYTVALNAGGGKINSGNVTGYTYGQGAALPTEVTKTGYTFASWYDNESCTGEPVTAIGNTAEGNKEYWAKWEAELYTITFETKGGSEISPITQAYGTSVTAPTAPTKDSHSFGGWYTDSGFENGYVFSTMPAENITLYAKWNQVKEDETKYTVNHNFENLDGSAYTTETEELFGTAGGDTAALAKSVTGFTAESFDQQTIEDDGTTVVEITYARNTYTLTIQPENGGDNSVETVTYGAPITVPAAPTRSGYTFAGWDKEIPATMPAEDVTIMARWSPLAGIRYTVKHNFVNLDGSTYTTETEELFGKTDEDTVAQAKTVTGFTAGSVTQQKIAGNGLTVIEITYTRNTYTLTIQPENGENDIVRSMKYGEVVTAAAPIRTGYTFVGWDTAIPETMPAENVTFTAQWTENDFYAVSYDTAGGNVIDSKTGVKWTDQVLDGIDDPTRDGWEFIGWKCGDGTVTAADEYGDLVTDDSTASVTLAAQWKDIKAPVISGVENGKTYCSAQTVRVYDNDVIASVTVNNDPVSLDIINRFTLFPAPGTQTIVVTDRAGNQSAEIIVTVNNTHIDANNDRKCDFCGTNLRVYNNNNSGGSNRNPADAPVNDAAAVETENKQDWPGQVFENDFSDQNGKNSDEPKDTATAKLPPEIIEGMGQSTTAGEGQDLAFRSNAAFSDFIRVEIDGKTLDQKRYTVEEDSMVVTLKADYVGTLSAGEHIIGIVSKGGTATTVFIVNEKRAAADDAAGSEGGSRSGLWVPLIFVGGCAFIVAVICGKRKKHQD